MFVKSARELTKVRTLTVTGIFIAVSMVIEMFTIELPFAKLNFAFLAIAVIGMLFGPTVGFMAGLVCDVVGFIAHPTGTFLPVYTLVAGLQGLIYGLCLYYKNDEHRILIDGTDITLFVRAVIARLLDVLVINLFMNTFLNLHYGFIHADSLTAALTARIAKNLIELGADILLLFVILPVSLMAYKRTFGKTAGV